MALALILIVLFFVLGAALGPLLLAGLTVALDEDRGRQLAQFAVGLGLKSVWKPVLTFTSSDELTLKKRSFDEKHDSEYVSFGGVFSSIKRAIHDPQDRLHSFYGTPFGFVDEVFGVVVDPRDVLLGQYISRTQANGQYTHRVERSESLHESVRAVFETPEGAVGVQLSNVAALFGGSFDSQLIDRIRDIYETSQAPKGESSALKQLLAPVMAFVGVVLLSMFIAGQTGGAGGGGSPGPSPPAGNGTTIEVGLLLLSISTSKLNRNWRNRLVYVALLVVGILTTLGLYAAFPPTISLLGIALPLGIWAVIALLSGMFVPAFVASFFGRSLGPIGMLLGKLYITIGLLGYDQPVIDLTESRYQLVEYDSREWEIEPHWYRFAMTRIGVGFPNDRDAWPDGTTMSPAKVEALADSGRSSFAPDDCVSTDAIQVGDIRGFLPDDPDDEAVHVRTDRTTGWFIEAGQARRLMMSALQNAKRDFGGGRQPVGDKWILGATLASMALGSVFSWVVFF